MIRIGWIGCGAHAQQHHVPALEQLRRQSPGRFEVVGVTDSVAERSRSVAERFGCRTFGHWKDIIGLEVDAAIVVTPPTATPEIVLGLAQRGVIVCMEKPLAPDGPTSEAFVAELGEAPVFVSMNRRFDPVLTKGLRLVDDRPPRICRAVMLREDRREPQFIEETAIHLVDQVLSVMGPLDWVGGVRSGPSFSIHLTGGDTEAFLQIAPRSGSNREAMEILGEGWRMESRSAWFDTGEMTFESEGVVVERSSLPQSRPVYERSGTLAEMEAFLLAAEGKRPLSPQPIDVLAAARICAKAASLPVG